MSSSGGDDSAAQSSQGADGPPGARPLSARHQRFADEYLIDANATRAYCAAFACKNKRTAATEGGKLLRNPEIDAYVKRRQGELAARLQVTQERILAEYARIAFSDARKVASWGPGGITLVPADLLEDDAALAVAEVKHKPGMFGVETSFKLHDKVAALTALGKHLGMFVEKHEHNVSVTLASLLAEAGDE